MKRIICSIHDVKAEAYLSPMFFMARGQAIRAFSDAVNGDSDIAKHPEDFTLFVIGEWSEDSGQIKGVVHESLGNGVNFLKGDEI